MSKDSLLFEEFITVHKDNKPDLIDQTIVALRILKDKKAIIPPDMQTVLLAIVAYVVGIEDEQNELHKNLDC